MNIQSLGEYIRSHPKMTVGSTILASFIALKIAHNLPLKDLDEKFITMMIDNNYELPPLIKDYLRIDPYNTSFTSFGDDTIIIIDHTHKKTYTVSCTNDIDWITHVNDIKDSETCLLREDPYAIKITGTVFGQWFPMTWKMIKTPFFISANRQMV
jgi:hypothetical protein